MSFYDDASLIMIPSGVKAGTVYSQKPMDSDGQFTFTRASEATRLVDGVVTKVRTNILLQSNDFSNASWSKNRSTIIAGDTAGPLTALADKITEDTSAGTHELVQTITVSSGSVYAISAYAKAGTRTKAAVVLAGTAFTSGGNGVAIFDLSSGTLVSTTGSLIDTNIEDAGNGWYRMTIVKAAASSSGVIAIEMVDASNNTSYTGDGSSYLYFSSFQLEQGTVSTPYIATTTVAVSEGPVANMPRLNSVAGGCKSLKLEPQRTNLWTYSEPTSGAAPPIASVTGYSDINEFSSVGLHGGIILGGGETKYQYGGSVSASTIYSLSCYMKTADNAAPVLANGSGDSSGDFLFVVGGDARDASEIPVADYSITLVSNNIYKVEYTFTTLSSVSFANTGIIKYSGNRNADLEITGFQLEAGSYPTSYIPTYGTAATRVADFLRKTSIASVINSPEGTMFFNVAALADDGSNRYFSINDGTTSNYIYFRYVSTSNQMLMRVAIGGVTINSLAYVSPDTTAFSKIAMKWKGGDYAFWVNGVERATDTTATAFGAGVLTELVADFPTGLGGAFPSKMKQMLLFPSALTDTELATLTTL